MIRGGRSARRRGAVRPIVCCDVGNTSLHIGWFRGTRLVRSTVRRFANGGWAGAGGRLRGADVVVASVSAPHLRRTIGWLRAQGASRVRILGSDLPFPIRAAVRRPREAGADRLANALAARSRVGAPAIVVDFGTAITIDVVDSSGAYAGGAIAPGLGLCAWALAARTDRLRHVRPAWPRGVVGKDTASCIRVGVVRGAAGMVESLLAGIREQVGDCPVLATGGDARWFARHCRSIRLVVPGLTLEGIRLAAAGADGAD